MKKSAFIALGIALAVSSGWARERWTEQEANAWFAGQPYRAGVNYVASDAVNAIEMWSPETFNPKRIDSELALAESIGFNTVRVFLNDQVWAADPEGFDRRIDAFLEIAKRHGIGVMLTFFTNGGNGESHLGKQSSDDGSHNGSWVKSPKLSLLADEAAWGILERYVKDVITRHAKDGRVIVWDIYNEPGNVRSSHIKGKPLKPDEIEAYTVNCFHLLQQSFRWARDCNPTQPITAGRWTGGEIGKIFNDYQFAQSDVISYHRYAPPEIHRKIMRELKRYHRPILCTEWMARHLGCTFDPILGEMKRANVWSYSWGLVAGKMETWRPWPNVVKPGDHSKDGLWFHDIYHADHTPYDPKETAYIQRVLKK